MKPVLYNRGGYVAHVSLKIEGPESFDAFVQAATIAQEHEGRVEALYDDVTPSRTRILGTERAGLVLEPGSLEDSDRLGVIKDKLHEERAGIKGGKGAAALDRLIALFEGEES